jgi:bifunctional UDP-N-acetylglucosamine pyrophosphorylase/glucosamine-1-phosphate N-acetyltransferase
VRPVAVVLAAGEGKRLKTRRAKVLHEVGGRALLDHVLTALAPLEASRVVVVVGHLRDQVEAHLCGRSLVLAVQDPPRGTGDAVAKGIAPLASSGEVLVLSGDVPLITSATLEALLAARREAAAGAAVLSARLPEPGGYGRLVRSAQGEVHAIVEARDATAEQLRIDEVNAGTYAFDLTALREALPQLRPENEQGEYYLTDVIGLLVASGRRVVAAELHDATEMTGVNTRAELAEVHRLLNHRTIVQLQAEGVTVLDPATTWVDVDCTVGPDTVLEPGVHLRQGCRIGRGCRVGAHAVLEGARVRDGEEVPPLALVRD